MGQRDQLGAIVASAAIVGVLGLSVIIGPDRSATVQPPQPGSPVPATPVVPDEPSRTDPVAPVLPARLVPQQVRIESITVDAPIVPVGLEEDGAMEIPERVAEIGWYDPDGLGVTPGSHGTAVLAGHVDSRSQGNGALYDLRELRVGAMIELDLEDGTTQRWRVTKVTQYPKDDLPLQEIFTWAGPPRLAVITCGGAFDRTARSYTDNIVVYAEPAEPSPVA